MGVALSLFRIMGCREISGLWWLYVVVDFVWWWCSVCLSGFVIGGGSPAGGMVFSFLGCWVFVAIWI